jgi:hypothetical protein
MEQVCCKHWSVHGQEQYTYRKSVLACALCSVKNSCGAGMLYAKCVGSFVVRKVCEAGMLQKPSLSLELKIRRSNVTSGSGRGIICSRYPTIKNIL